MIKKILFFLTALAIITSVIVYFFGSSILNKSIKKGVETFGPQITQTPIQLDKVNLSILSGNGTLSGLYVGNPEGFTKDTIFALNQIDVDVNTKSIFSDQIVINKIHIRKPQINYEKSLRSSNFNELLKNIESSTPESSEKSTPEKDVASKEEPAKQVLIKELIIEDGTISVIILGIEAEILLPRIEINDLGKTDEDNSVGDVLTRILNEVLQIIIPTIQQQINSTEVGSDDVINKLIEPGKNVIKNVNEQINGLINQ